jgi:hypothetical protein
MKRSSDTRWVGMCLHHGMNECGERHERPSQLVEFFHLLSKKPIAQAIIVHLRLR